MSFPVTEDPATPLRSEGHQELVTICSAMKNWLVHETPSPEKCDSVDEEQAKSSNTSEDLAKSEDRCSPQPSKPLSDQGSELEEPKVQPVDLSTASPKSSPKPDGEAASMLDDEVTHLDGVDPSVTQVACKSPSITQAVNKAAEANKSVSNSSGPQSLVLSDAPLPTPLPIIQAITARVAAKATKCPSDVWSISNWYEGSGADKVANSVNGGPCDSLSRLHATDTESCNADVQLNGWTMAAGDHLVPVESNVLVESANCSFGIDPMTGCFLPTIVQPETIKPCITGKCIDFNDIAWRQANMTSELYIKKELKSRENIAMMLRASLEMQKGSHTATLAHVDVESDSPWPSAKCVIRPVLMSDFPQIAEIMNAEAASEDNPQIFANRTVGIDDVARMFTMCALSDRPFIVVTPSEDDLLDRNKWPKHSDKVYEVFSKFITANPQPPPQVVGFAYVTESRIGFECSPCPGSRYSGQVKLVVSPEHRRNMFGSAMLDRILSVCSPFHRSLVDYEWQCASPNGVYEYPATRNTKQYHQLYIETFETEDSGSPLAWKEKMLKKFEFRKAAQLHNCVKTDRHHESVWLDLSLWECLATPESKIVDKICLKNSDK